jgi:hypothetical protein
VTLRRRLKAHTHHRDTWKSLTHFDGSSASNKTKMEHAFDSELVSATEAALALRVCENTLQRWYAPGRKASVSVAAFGISDQS